MPSEQVEGFANNWAYLKAELYWLDRVLMTAAARQRKETKEIDRVTRAPGDKATSHWWKGLVALEGKIAYDEHRTPQAVPDITKPNFQQQLDEKILRSRRQGVALGLPILRDRLQLTLFEKNLVVLLLAPEINRRYSRLYSYLRGEEPASGAADLPADLPTVDLVLRLLCRNDQEWQDARQRLLTDSPLLRHNVVSLLLDSDHTLLNTPLKLVPAAVNYLLSDRPTEAELTALLSQTRDVSHLLTERLPLTEWSRLILPAALLSSLQVLAHRIKFNPDLELLLEHNPRSPGQVALLVGPTGTGKTLAAEAIAHTLQVPLCVVDLNSLKPDEDDALLRIIAAQSPAILLIKSADRWLRQSSSNGSANVSAELHQLLTQRRKQECITLFSARLLPTVSLSWQQQMDVVLKFPIPNRNDRLKLWQSALPPEIALAEDVDLQQLSQKRLTGGEIRAIVQTAIVLMLADGTSQLAMTQIRRAIVHHCRVM